MLRRIGGGPPGSSDRHQEPWSLEIHSREMFEALSTILAGPSYKNNTRMKLYVIPTTSCLSLSLSVAPPPPLSLSLSSSSPLL